MSEPFFGEIRMFTFGFAPKGWLMCNGQLLPINENQALFSLLGTMYGGDGRTTFALPDLRGSAPVHAGPGSQVGQRGGETAHTVTKPELPAHAHLVSARPAATTTASPEGALWTSGVHPSFAAAPTTAMADAAVTPAGASQPHENMPPYLVTNFAIAVSGIFPSRN